MYGNLEFHLIRDILMAKNDTFRVIIVFGAHAPEKCENFESDCRAVAGRERNIAARAMNGAKILCTNEIKTFSGGSKFMKIKNLLMQWFILTPLAFVNTICGSMILYTIIMIFTGSEGPSSFVTNMIVFSIIGFGAGCLVSKLILKIKGKEVEYTYWDSEFEYEIKHEYGDKYRIDKTKGGWTQGNKAIVWLYMLISPINILLQLIADIFAVVAFFNKRIASWYGAINYDTFDHPWLQKIVHFLFNFVILSEGYELSK